MKRVLFVSYYFPPSGGPGVQRVLKFVKYLREFGWNPVVLTVRDGDYPARDPSLLAEVPDDVPVFRTRIFEPYRFYRRLTGKAPGTAVDVNTIPKPGERRSAAERFAEFVRATFFVPDARMAWRGPAVREGLRAIGTYGISAVYSSSPPYTCALVARDLRRRSGVPWVAGFRDPWRGFLSAPKRWAVPDRLDRRLERSVYAECDRMEVAWRGIAKDFAAKYPGVPADKVRYLPNGFDGDDFREPPPPPGDVFTVTYTGSMYGKRNPSVFLDAVESLVAGAAVDPRRLRLRFIGRFGADVRAMLDRPALAACIEVVDYLPHAESVRALRAADVLLLVVDDHTGNEEIVPGKVFEYIGAGKPIVALAPEGAVADVLRETAAGSVADPHDADAIARIVRDCYDRWRNGSLGLERDRDAVRKYERREVARELARLLDDVSST